MCYLHRLRLFGPQRSSLHKHPPRAPLRSRVKSKKRTSNPRTMENDIFDLNALATRLPGANPIGSTATLTTLPIEINITIIELLISPNERMKGLGLIRSVNRELRHVVDTILFARLALGAMSLDGVQHHLSLLENPLSSRLCNYTTTVSLSLASWTSSPFWGDEPTRQMCSQKDEATASILQHLTNLAQIELDFLPFSSPRRIDGWQWWPKTIAALEEIRRHSSAADNTPRPFIRALALHAIRPSMDHLIGQILNALVPNLNALVLATDSNHIYKANNVDFAASWTSIQQHATDLVTLVVSGVPLTTPNGSWACSQSLRSLDITSAPSLTPTLAYELICQFPSLRNVTLRSIRLRLVSTLPPRESSDIYTRTKSSTHGTGTGTGTGPTSDSSLNANTTTTRPRNPISLQTLSLSSLDIDFVAALSFLGTTTLHLQVIHRSKTLLHILKQPSAFIGLSRLVVGNEEGMTGRVYGWLGANETEELRTICKERGCTFEDERFSGTR